MLRLVWALREFRPYLYGQRFLVRTDHSCLRWLRNFKEPEGQVARWLESLAELDFEVEHRPGRLHGNADALSRTSCAQCGRPMKSSMCAVRAAPSGSAVVAQTLRDQLLAAQQTDPEIQLLRQWVTSGPWPTQCPHEYSRDLKVMWQQGPIWIVQEDLICRHRDGLTAEEGATQVLVPRALRSEIMRSLHNSRYAGHLGERRTLQDQKPILLARDEWGRTLMVPHVHAVCGEKKAVKKQPRTDAANDFRLSAAASENGHLGAAGKDPVWQPICPGIDGLLYQVDSRIPSY
ncbi:Retrovirus-related Pol polyprotein from transposon [Trichinella murrelli]|uniref:RNA-directed DNA polymerase n=1 Tax=Trichinella murrelli TaxID=144512 RepID=A0A0V0T633_9BILA|nr:Retrovirus-related Pol polyprotein from transposon [Trichinella murrelli]KRX34007.1 Retrovirus-related Pol polyprotein from transposon [Trichinella murrelli]KRX49016.1 Retrovirus-related Pol polyprotein from transposon [Trichinella murrelli]